MDNEKRWVYKTTCEGCKNYSDFRMSIKGEVTVTKYCSELQAHIINPKNACYTCSYNRAYPSTWYKIKYKLSKLWKKNL